MRSEFAIVSAMLGEVLEQLGFLDQAVIITRDAVEFAREQSTAFLFGFTLNWMASVYRTRGDIEETLATADALESLVEKYGLSDHLGKILIARGWATAKKGQRLQNLEMMNSGLKTLKGALKTDLRVEAQLEIVELSLISGDTKAGVAALQAIELSRPFGEGLLTFYVQFFKAYFLAMSGVETDAHEAEALFRSCLDHARKWQLKLPELNSATGLARLMARTGRRSEARAMLANIYNWFTEGFETAPLRGAKALLDELSG
jgi:tetratricopeptide (TPR) repeat protein